MDQQTLINLVGGVILSALGWFAREIWVAMKELRADVHRIEVDLPKAYVTKQDHDTRMDKIENMFQRIFDKLDEKADKK